MVKDYFAEAEEQRKQRLRREEDDRIITERVEKRLEAERKKYGQTIRSLFKQEEEAWRTEIDKHQDNLLSRLFTAFEELKKLLSDDHTCFFELTKGESPTQSITLTKQTQCDRHEYSGANLGGASARGWSSTTYTFQRYLYQFTMSPDAPNTLGFRVLYAVFSSNKYYDHFKERTIANPDYPGVYEVIQSVDFGSGQLSFFLEHDHQEVYNLTLPLPLPRDVFPSNQLQTLVNALIADSNREVPYTPAPHSSEPVRERVTELLDRSCEGAPLRREIARSLGSDQKVKYQILGSLSSCTISL